MMRFLWFTLLLPLILTLTACAHTPSRFDERQDVQVFIHHMVTQHHFKENELKRLFSEVRTQKTVLQKIQKPLEQATWRKYQRIFLDQERIRMGKAFSNRYRNVLSEAESRYHVSPAIIVATLGVETKYGTRQGEHRVFDALANLAFNHKRRAVFFKSELEHFLLFTREYHLPPFEMQGSYAGAIGQPQFMPSSYRRYAVSYTNSRRIDLVRNTHDSIVSIANYYHRMGWQFHGPIASKVQKTNREVMLARYKNQKRTIAEWRRLGIRPSGTYSASTVARLVELNNGDSKEYWLAFPNFEVIKRYNPSDLYAMAIMKLSQYVASGQRIRN